MSATLILLSREWYTRVMMRGPLLFGSLLVLSVLSVVYAAHTYADADQTLSDDQIARIKQNCVAAQTTMTQLQQNDTGIRLSLGQQYEFISGKLMAPMNSRIVLNQMNVGPLVATAATFQQQIDNFRASYLTYGESLDAAVRDDCRKNPQQFYNDVATARTNRQAVQVAVQALNATLDQYGSQVNDFAKNLKASGGIGTQ